MRDQLHLDHETAADVDLTNVGLDVYTQPSSRGRMLMTAYRLNGGRMVHHEYHRGKPPAELVEALEDPEVEKWAFNAQFERITTRRFMKVKTPIRRWRCSQVLAYMQSFMGRLEDVAPQIGLPLDKQKMKDGKRLVRLFTMPQRTTKNQPHEWRNWITDPDDWELFCEYNMQDVVTEESVKARLIKYPIQEDEWDFYELDQLINDRGVPVDWDFINNVIWMADRRKRDLLDRMQRITGADNPNSRDQILPWLQENGYPYSDIRKESVTKTLNRAKLGEIDLTKEGRAVLRLRQWAARTSVSKAIAARRCAGQGHVVRYMYQFAGASRTNRFAGRLVQPQNMTVTPKLLDPEDNDEKLTLATDLIREGNYDGFELFLNEPMLAFTGCMRSMFRAPKGRTFQVCDYRSVESAGLAWVSGCKRLLEVFENGLDPYKDFGTLFYEKPYDMITRPERGICKPPSLGCGYRLSAGKIVDGVKTGLLAYAENMGVDMTQEQATRAVTVFRQGYPEIPQLWYAYEKAIHFVLKTHLPTAVGPIGFEWLKPYLLIRLPSGRFIFYYKPRLEKRVVWTGRMKKVRSEGEFIHGVPKGAWVEEEETYLRTVFTYMGRNQKTTQWDRVEGHGGVTTENVVQALTRDVLKVGLQRLHKAGFNIIGHSHDEGMVLQRIGDNQFTLALMRELFRAPVSWAPGFPLNAAGWEKPFYRK